MIEIKLNIGKKITGLEIMALNYEISSTFSNLQNWCLSGSYTVFRNVLESWLVGRNECQFVMSDSLSLNSFPTIIKIKKFYIQTTIFFIYFQKQTIGCMKLNSIYFMFISIGQNWCNCVQELIIMQNYTSQLIRFP